MQPPDEIHEALLADAGWVRALARSLVRDDHAAADVAQDALAAAVEQRPPLLGGTLRGWLRGAVRHFAARRHREKRARRRRESRAAKPLSCLSEEQAVERLRLHKRLTEAVLSLPEPYRVAVIGRYFDGMSPAEIARERNLPPELVRQHIHRALAKLRAHLDRDFGERRAWSTALIGLYRGHATTAGTTLGFTAMKKLAIGAAAAVTLLAVTLQLLQPPGRSPDTAPGESDPSLTAAAASETAVGTEGDTSPDRTQIALNTAPTLTLEVVDAAGAPVPGARTWSWVDGTNVADRGDTDAEGRIVLTGASQPGYVLVLADGQWPESRELPELLGHHEVVLSPGEVLQGWVRVDGEVPREPIELLVIGSPSPIPESAPAELRAELEAVALYGLPVTTRPDGSFRLGGLPATWSGRLTLEDLGIHWFRDASPIEPSHQNSLTLPEPRADLQLELTELPIVQGRVVWSNTDQPVDGASVTISLSFEGNPLGFGIASRPDGTFRVGIFRGDSWRIWADPEQREEFDFVTIEVRHDAALEPQRVELSAAELGPRGSVGTIALDPRPLVHFLVVDLDGQPVPGALVRGRTLSEPTDREGRGEVLPTDRPYTVGALGYTIEDQEPVTGAGESNDPFVFVLEPGNVLNLRFRDSQGNFPAVERVLIHARESLFVGGQGLRPGQQVTAVHQALMDSSVRGGSHEGLYMRLEVGGDGRSVLTSMVPEAKFTLQIYGRLRDLGMSQELVAPGPTEKKEIEILVPESFRVAGQVLNERGAPVSNARVQIWPGPSSLTDGSVHIPNGPVNTGQDGSFAFEPVFAELNGATLQVTQHRGHAPLFLNDLRLGPDTGPLILRLETGHDLDVRIVDPTGFPVPVDRVDVEGLPEGRGGPNVWSHLVEPGVFRYEDLPAGTAVFWCEVAGKRYEVSHQVRAGVTAATIQVPEIGRLLLLAPDGMEGRRRARITRHPLGVELEEQVASLSDRETREILLPPGEYDVVLEEVLYERRVEVGRRVVGGPVRITVRARELTECKLN